jgi:hypothetical protein
MEQTEIFKQTPDGEALLGYLGSDGVIYRLRWGEGRPIGRVDGDRLLRQMSHDERELGTFTADGRVRAGLTPTASSSRPV